MSKRIEPITALALLDDIDSVCQVTNNFSLTSLLEKHGCSSMQSALIEAGFIEPLKTKGSWNWIPKQAPDIKDAEKLLRVHYGDKSDAVENLQSELTLLDKNTDAIADRIAGKIIAALRVYLPGLIKQAVDMSKSNA